MELTDLLSLIALIGIAVVLAHGIDDRDLWPEVRPSRFDLGWPRGVQEEEPVPFRTELARHTATATEPRSDRR